MASIKDKIAAQNQVATPTTTSAPKQTTTQKIAAQNTPTTTKPAKQTTSQKIATQNAPKTASNGSQPTNKTSSTKKKVITVEEYNKLAQQKREERQVKLKDTMMRRNSAIINASATGNDILEGVNTGKVGSETLTQLQQTNPELYNDYLSATQDQSALNLMNFMSGQMQTLSGFADSINQKFLTEMQALEEKRVGTKELYDKYVNSEDTLAKGEAVTSIENEIEELQVDMDWIEDDIRSQYDGKASESFIQSMIAKRQKDLIPLFRKKESEYRKAQLDYNSALQQWQVEFEFALEDARYEQQRQAEILQTKYNMTMDSFKMQKDAVMMTLDFATKEYFQQKSFEDQLELMSVQEQYKKEAMIFDYEMQAKYAPKWIKTTTIKMWEGANEELWVMDEAGNILQRYKPWQGNWTPVVPPSGQLAKDPNTGRVFDSVALPDFQAAYAELKNTGLIEGMTFAPAHRDQAQTIMDMAKKYGIVFNVLNPNKTAAELRTAWHRVADIGHSKHETGMAVDIYSEWMKAPTADQMAVLRKHWWVQTLADQWDAGHFEYVWVKQLDMNSQTIVDTVDYLKNEWWKWRAAATFWLGIPFTQSADYATKFKFLRDSLTLDQLINAKERWATFGALSDAELMMLSNSASSLSLKTTREAYDEELDRIKMVITWQKTPSQVRPSGITPATPTPDEYSMEDWYYTDISTFYWQQQQW